MPSCTDRSDQRTWSRRGLLVAAAGGFVAACTSAACTSEVAVERPPKLGFAHLPPLRLAVGDIEIIAPPAPSPSSFSPTAPSPSAPALPTPPRAALVRWAGERLQAAGGPARARFVITEASVSEAPVARGLETYEAAAAARLQIGDAFAESRATRTLRIPAAYTLNQRELAWLEMVEALMRDFDADMERRIHRHLAPWLA